MRTNGAAAGIGLAAWLAGSVAGAQTAVVAPGATPWQRAEPPAAAEDDAASARAVERLLAMLDADNRERRVLALAVGVGGGAVVTGVGAWMLTRSEGERWAENPGLLIGAGGVGLMLGGALNVALPGYLHELGDSWRQTAGQPIAVRRSHFGVVLDELAEKARTQRRFAGFFSLVGGAAFVATAALLYGLRDHTYDGVVSPEFVLGFAGALFMASSVPLLTIRSPVEHAAMFWHAGDARPSVRLVGASVVPTRGGALAGVTLVF